jgi:hypothetical protein
MSYATSPITNPRPRDDEYDDDREVVSSGRMYLAEPGWRIGVKAGSDREFCYMMMPGQDFYHRLLDGEIYLQRHGEKLCLACASRRGLLVAEPKRLREFVIPIPADEESIPLDLGWLDGRRS